MAATHTLAGPAKPDIDEHGSPVDGRPQVSTERLFMQLQVFTDCHDHAEAVDRVRRADCGSVVYEDANDPYGIAVLTWSTDPAHFLDVARAIWLDEPFASMSHKPDFTMLGRTYSLGYERDLRDWLIEKPIATVTRPDARWAVWYPLRRKGAFTQLPEPDQRKILMEHGHIGMAFGAADYAHDVRLACQGLDTFDNDFVIGLIGKELYPLSAIVQTMRKTVQTSTYLERLGPFFVGRAIHQHAGR